MKTLLIMATLLALNSAGAQAEDRWTEVGGYIFASSIKGDAQIGNVEADVDVTFGDILDHLDFGAMGFIEHRRGKWSFIGDVGYMATSGDNTVTSNGSVNAKLDAEFDQTTVQGFVGYRAIEENYNNASFGLDILGGFRYIKLETEIGIKASLSGLAGSLSRDQTEDWVDGVIGVRAQYKNDNGWGASAQADYGKGSDSNSYQLIGLVNYSFENNVSVFGGYQILDLDYKKGVGVKLYDIDLNYQGPRLGVSYRF